MRACDCRHTPEIRDPKFVGIIRVPGENNADVAILKDTSFHERYRIEFRSEFFNAFNHPSFGQLNLQLGSAD